MKHPAPSPILRAGLGLTLLVCAGVPISCASSTTREQRQIDATARIEDPIRMLEARAELETLNPLPAPSESLLRRLVRDDSEPLTPGTESYRRALLSADEIEIANEFDAPPSVEAPDQTRQRHAMKLYTRARVLRQQGQLQEAAQVLVRASELDPSSSSIMIALGDVYVAMSDAVGANNAYERAIELGDRSASPLIYLASREYALGNDERVMSLCTLALRGDEIDPQSAP
ncbi:MAG TPA: tetratricopeptide repeat protein, partial [Gammaproteobacteria bacterium]|nr:tetratricopeptide repeat protein [Gammaproteobacteria bacterium]